MGTIRELVYMPLSSLLEADRNPKLHNDEGVIASINAFGYVEPQLLDERTGKLVAGHGRLKALRTLRESGAVAPDGILADEAGEWSAPVVRGWSSKDDREAEAVGIALNQQTIAGGFDERILSEMLHSFDDVVGHGALGFDEDEWDAHMAAFAILDGREPAQPKPIDPNAMYVECPNCQHRFVP
jgi:hypothetical protein